MIEEVKWSEKMRKRKKGRRKKEKGEKEEREIRELGKAKRLMEEYMKKNSIEKNGGEKGRVRGREGELEGD